MSIAMNDNEIIQEYLSGDEAAFSEIVKRHLKPVYNFIFRMVNDRDVTEDLTQITFVKAWKHLRRYDVRRNFRTWLFTIAKNTTFDYFKRKKKFRFRVSRTRTEKAGWKISLKMKFCRTKFWSERISLKNWTPFSKNFLRTTAPFCSCIIKKTSPSTKSPKSWANPTTPSKADIRGD